MKAAISAAVTTYAQAAGAWRDRDTATIERLHRQAHDMGNRLLVAEVGIQLIVEALELELPDGTTTAGAIDAVLAEIRRTR
jgi:hypothetical protein